MDLDFVSFELDCELLVDHVNNNKEDIYEFGAIVAHCRGLLSLKPNFNVEFVSR